MTRWLGFVGLAALASLPGCVLGDNPIACYGMGDSKCAPGTACVQVAMAGSPTGEQWRCLATDDMGNVRCSLAGSSHECTADRPICSPMGTCVTCDKFADSDGACRSALAATPFCVVAGVGKCVACRKSGAGFEGCDARSATPVCDETVGKCAPCSKHDDCSLAGGTGICKLPEYMVPANEVGACAAAAEVTVVAQAAELNTAVNNGTGPRFILARPGNYDPVVVVTTNVNKVVVGAGRDAATSSKINRDAGFQSLNFIATGTLFLDGVLASGTVNCISNSRVSVYRSIVSIGGADVNGIDAVNNSCRALTVVASTISNAGQVGINVGRAVDYKVINSLVLRSAQAQGAYAVSIDSSLPGVFAFNTLTGNANGGIQCTSNATIDSSVIVNNGVADSMVPGKGQRQYQVGSSCVLKDVVLGIDADPAPAGVIKGTPIFKGSGQAPSDYQLKDGNQACCSQQTTVDPKIPTDYFGSRRGRRDPTRTDVGFHESP